MRDKLTNPIDALTQQCNSLYVTHASEILHNAILKKSRSWWSFFGARFVIRHGANINAPFNGDYPLILAVQHERFDIVALLLANHADTSVKNSEGQTAMVVAANLAFTSVMQDLQMAGANINEQLHNGNTLLHNMIAQGKHNLAQFIISTLKADPNIKNNQGHTPLYLAAQAGMQETMKLLHAAGARVNELYEEGNSLLHIAIIKGENALAAFMIDTLKIDVNLINTALDSAMHVAVRSVNPTAIEKLFQSNAKITSNQKGLSPYGLLKSLSYYLSPHANLPQGVTVADCKKVLALFEKYAIEEIQAFATNAASAVGSVANAIVNATGAVVQVLTNANKQNADTDSATATNVGSQVLNNAYWLATSAYHYLMPPRHMPSYYTPILMFPPSQSTLPPLNNILQPKPVQFTLTQFQQFKAQSGLQQPNQPIPSISQNELEDRKFCFFSKTN